MKFGLPGVKPEISYTIADINRIQLRDKIYRLRIVLYYIENNIELFKITSANIQFGRQLRIGARIIGNDVKLGDRTIHVNLPDWLCRSNSESLLSTDCMDDESHHQGRFDYIESGYRKPLRHDVVRLTPRGKFLVNDKYVHFIIIPTYEFYRFFVFGYNKYNELLMEGSSFENKKSNKIFNPLKTGVIIDDSQKKYCYIHLRKNIVDESAKVAGDLAFYPDIKNLAKNMVGAMAHEEKSRFNFKKANFPIRQAKTIGAYGRFVKDKEGKDGFYVESFSKIEYGELYYFGRDNDGTSTSSRNENMPKIYNGIGKQKVKQKVKTPIDHDKTGDGNIESEPLNETFESFDFEDRTFDEIRIGKETQENIAGDKIPGGETEPKGRAPISGIGPGHTGFIPIENTIPLGPNDITEMKYWEGFKLIIRYMSSRLKNEVPHTIEYFGTDLKFKSEEVKSNYLNFLNIENEREFYLVKVKTEGKTFYIIELNPEFFDAATMVFWNKYNDGIIIYKDLIVFLEKHFVCNGKAKTTASFITNITLKFGIIKHQYKGSDKRFKKDEALKHQGEKLASFIITKRG